MTDTPLSELATEAAKQVLEAWMNNFEEPDKKNLSYRRAMFRQQKDFDYGCTMVVDVHLVDGDKSAHIITKMGKA